MIAAARFQRNVARLQRLAATVHDRMERRVHGPLNVGYAAEALTKLDLSGPTPLQLFAHMEICLYVGAAETVDRLLRVSHHEQLAWDGRRSTPVGLPWIVGREQQQQLGLQWVRVLEFVDENPAEPRLEVPPHRGIITKQISCTNQQIKEVECALARFQAFVLVDAFE